MSTAQIREALDRLQAAAHNADDDGIWNLALSARAEVEAIEKAAQFMASASQDVHACVEAMRTLTTIAAQRNAGTAGAAGPKDGATGPQE